MKNLSTPQSILFGLALIALAIASVPYSSKIVKPAFASSEVHKIAICNKSGSKCVDVHETNWDGNYLKTLGSK